MHRIIEKSSVTDFFRSFGKNILDVLFPLYCLGCGASDILLCDHCLTDITPALEQRCPFCRRHHTPHGETCFSCSDQKALDGVFVGYDYGNVIVEKSLHAFKYQSIESLSNPLGILLANAIRSTDIAIPDILIPVPLHPWRLRYRGFNQSELLGRYLASTLLPGTTLSLNTRSLVRHRFTIPQQKMRDAKTRKHNIKNAFSVQKSERSALSGKYIWLIDDVATTASTLESCAKELKKAGAKKVFGIVLARG